MPDWAKIKNMMERASAAAQDAIRSGDAVKAEQADQALQALNDAVEMEQNRRTQDSLPSLGQPQLEPLKTPKLLGTPAFMGDIKKPSPYAGDVDFVGPTQQPEPARTTTYPFQPTGVASGLAMASQMTGGSPGLSQSNLGKNIQRRIIEPYVQPTVGGVFNFGESGVGAAGKYAAGWFEDPDSGAKGVKMPEVTGALSKRQAELGVPGGPNTSNAFAKSAHSASAEPLRDASGTFRFQEQPADTNLDDPDGVITRTFDFATRDPEIPPEEHGVLAELRSKIESEKPGLFNLENFLLMLLVGAPTVLKKYMGEIRDWTQRKQGLEDYEVKATTGLSTRDNSLSEARAEMSRIGSQGRLSFQALQSEKADLNRKRSAAQYALQEARKLNDPNAIQQHTNEIMLLDQEIAAKNQAIRNFSNEQAGRYGGGYIALPKVQ